MGDSAMARLGGMMSSNKISIRLATMILILQQQKERNYIVDTGVQPTPPKIVEEKESKWLECQSRILFRSGIERTINKFKRSIMLTKSMHSVGGLGKWDFSRQREKCSRPKAHEKEYSQGKPLLSEREPSSGSRESAAVHFVQLGPVSYSNGASKSDYDLAVVRTVETLTVAGYDAPVFKQEKEAWSSGGI
jgi:hypothetical protein